MGAELEADLTNEAVAGEGAAAFAVEGSETVSPEAPESSQFARTELLLGADAVRHLGECRVAVFGCGGVGGYVIEALARSGVGSLDLVDKDVFDITNLNRQILATHDTIGRSKVQVAAERVRSINPACQVNIHKCFYLPETRERFDFSAYDYVVDAVDTVAAKLDLISAAHDAGTPIVSSMGAGNKLDPTAFQVADIYETSVCPLAKVIRRECRKRGIESLKVVYSQEEPAVRRQTPGSVAFVPSVAGLIIASEVVKDLIR